MNTVQLLSERAKINRLNSSHILLQLLNSERNLDIAINDNPHDVMESPLFPKRIILWCAMSCKEIHAVVLHENVAAVRYLDLEIGIHLYLS